MTARQRAWREANKEHLNAARRVRHEPRECVGCRLAFVPRRSDARWCCPACRVYARPDEAWMAAHREGHR